MSNRVNKVKNVTSINFNISQKLKAMMEPPASRREGKGVKWKRERRAKMRKPLKRYG